MYVDNLLVLSGAAAGAFGVAATGQALTTGTILSTNTVDLLQNRNIGEGADHLFGRMSVIAALTGGTSLTPNLITADDAALTVNVTVIGTMGTILTAALTTGARFVCESNPRINTVGRRYLGMQYVIVGTYGAGSVFADVGPDIQDGQDFYPSGFSVT